MIANNGYAVVGNGILLRDQEVVPLAALKIRKAAYQTIEVFDRTHIFIEIHPVMVVMHFFESGYDVPDSAQGNLQLSLCGGMGRRIDL